MAVLKSSAYAVRGGGHHRPGGHAGGDQDAGGFRPGRPFS